MRFYFLIILLSLIAQLSKAEKFEVKFYCESLTFNNRGLTLNTSFQLKSDSDVMSIINAISAETVTSLVADLNYYITKYDLNSWYQYELIKCTVAKLTSLESSDTNTFFEWYLLVELGYNVKLGYTTLGPKILALSKDHNIGLRKLYDYYVLEYGLTQETYDLVDLSMLNLSGKKAFNFALKLPKFDCGDYVEKNYHVVSDYNRYRFAFKSNLDHIDALVNHPEVDIREYFDLSLSDSVRKTLVKDLRTSMSNMSTYKGLRFLLSFVRQNYLFESDTSNYGINRPITADEALFYTLYDSRGCSVLFYSLVKELLHLPMIVLESDEHYYVGVEANNNLGINSVSYEGMQFIICDPSDLKDELGLGESFAAGEPNIILHYEGG